MRRVAMLSLMMFLCVLGSGEAIAEGPGNRFHVVSGDVQSAGTGMPLHSDAHDAFEFTRR